MSALTKTLRVKAAIVLAVLYVLCILAPAVAFALSDNPAVAHCLTEGHVGVHDHGAQHEHGGKLHVHGDGTAHQHHDDGVGAARLAAILAGESPVSRGVQSLL